MNENDQNPSKEALLKDLLLIKEAAQKSNNLFRYLSLAQGIKKLALWGTGLVAVSCGIVIWLPQSPSIEASQELAVQVLLYSLLAVSVVLLGIYKIRLFLNLGRAYRKDITFSQLMHAAFSKPLLRHLIPQALVMIALIIFFSWRGEHIFIVPIVTLFFSIIIFSMIAHLGMRELFGFAFWLLISGIASLFLAPYLSTPLMILSNLGIGMLALYFGALVVSRRQNRGQK